MRATSGHGVWLAYLGAFLSVRYLLVPLLGASLSGSSDISVKSARPRQSSSAISGQRALPPGRK